ncbi:MAG TPA: beta-galactosidase, partial [Phycisphaerae bacterium]|nr:beta-galactosidase [Phycisphaerae bacterium]
MKRIKVIGFAVLVLCALVVTSSQAQTLSLGGQWSFRLDSANAGEASRWYSQSLPDKLRLPGSLQEQGFGNDVTAQTNWVARAVRGENSGYPNWYTSPMFEKYRQPGSISYPYWLQPKKHYVGAAWYQRQI